MALTRYVQETKKSLFGAQGELQPQQLARQLPSRPSVNTSSAQLSQQSVRHMQPVKQSVDQEVLSSKQVQLSQLLSTSLEHPVQERPQNVRVNLQSLPNQNLEPVEKSLPETLQKQHLPSYVYQLFEKKEVIEVVISHVSHRFSCLVFHWLSTHSPFLTTWPWAEQSSCSVLGLFIYFLSFVCDQTKTFTPLGQTSIHATYDVYSWNAVETLIHGKCYRYCFSVACKIYILLVLSKRWIWREYHIHLKT